MTRYLVLANESVSVLRWPDQRGQHYRGCDQRTAGASRAVRAQSECVEASITRGCSAGLSGGFPSMPIRVGPSVGALMSQNHPSAEELLNLCFVPAAKSDFATVGPSAGWVACDAYCTQ